MTALSGDGPPLALDQGDLARLQEAADAAAARGAALVRRAFVRIARGRTAEPAGVKGAGDYVTDADRRSETAIRETLAEVTPDIPVLAEEGGGERGPLYWAVDPLDGTTNFMLGMPVVGISVALVAAGRPVAAAVRAPMLGLAFGGIRGGGAWSGDRRLRVSDRPPSRAIVATGFPFRRKALLARYLPVFESLLRDAEDLRRAGAAALDLAWVASGVFDGFFELNLGEWDVAAGSLLVEEAGGVVTDWDGGPDFLAGEILAGSAETHRMMLRAVRQTGRADHGGRGPAAP